MRKSDARKMVMGPWAQHFASRMRIPKVVVEGRERDVPPKVLQEAINLAARICPPCRRCGETCNCNGYIRAMHGVICRHIHNWERQCFIELLSKATWKEEERKGVGMGYAWLLEDAARHPIRRHPEHDGFEIDHTDGERWRRFYIPKSLKLRRK